MSSLHGNDTNTENDAVEAPDQVLAVLVAPEKNKLETSMITMIVTSSNISTIYRSVFRKLWFAPISTFVESKIFQKNSNSSSSQGDGVQVFTKKLSVSTGIESEFVFSDISMASDSVVV